MPRSPSPATSANNLRGILWMAVGTLCMSSMHGLVRYVSGDLHPFEIAFFRLCFGLIVVLPWFVKLGWQPLKTKRPGLQVARGVLNLSCMLAFFFALSITPLAEATALMFTAPIFTTFLAMGVFGERAGFRRWAAIGVGFLGALVVLRPGFTEIGLGPILVMFSAFVWAICMIMIKELGRTDSSITITVYMSLVMAPLSLVPALFYWQWPTLEQIAWLVAIGLVGGAGQMAMAEALKLGDTHAVLPVEFVKLIWISIIAYVAFAEVPGLFTWLGGAMIFAATAYITIRERALRKPPAP